jgi:CheY-like chemotaxis protein
MAASEPLTILLAEDDAGHASLVERNLRRGGFTNPIVHVSDGQEALDFIHREGAYADRSPDGPLLLLLDIKMPRVDGTEVLRRLKEGGHLSRVPVIVLTTTDDPREVQRCYDLGCNVYVIKPVAYDAFVEAVKRLGLFLSIVRVPREDDRV